MRNWQIWAGVVLAALTMQASLLGDDALRPDQMVEEQTARALCYRFLKDLGNAEWAKVQGSLTPARRELLADAKKGLTDFTAATADEPKFVPFETACAIVFRLDTTGKFAYVQLTFTDEVKKSHTLFFKLVKSSMDLVGRNFESWGIDSVFPSRLDRFFLWAEGRDAAIAAER